MKKSIERWRIDDRGPQFASEIQRGLSAAAIYRGVLSVGVLVGQSDTVANTRGTQGAERK